LLTLILLPGLDGTGDLFGPLLRECDPELQYQIIRYPAEVHMNYVQLTDFVRARLPAENDFVLLGESFSGPIAISIAAESNNRLKGLILCCTFASNPRPELSALSSLLALFPMQLASTSILLKCMLGKFSTSALCLLIQKAIQSIPSQTLRSRLLQVIAVNVEDKIKKIAVPVLYLKAKNDWFVPANASNKIQQLNSNVRIAEVDGPHFLLQANARETAAMINEFILEIAAQRKR